MWKTCAVSENKQSQAWIYKPVDFSCLAVFRLCASAGKPDLPPMFADQGVAGTTLKVSPATVKLSPAENARVALHRRTDTWTRKWKKHQRWDHAFAVLLLKKKKKPKAAFHEFLLWMWSTMKNMFFSDWGVWHHYCSWMTQYWPMC